MLGEPCFCSSLFCIGLGPWGDSYSTLNTGNSLLPGPGLPQMFVEYEALDRDRLIQPLLTWGLPGSGCLSSELPICRLDP